MTEVELILAITWKRRAEIAEAKVEDLLQRQDEMAAQIEGLRHRLMIDNGD